MIYGLLKEIYGLLKEIMSVQSHWVACCVIEKFTVQM